MFFTLISHLMKWIEHSDMKQNILLDDDLKLMDDLNY